MALYCDCLTCCDEAGEKLNEKVLAPTRDDSMQTFMVPNKERQQSEMKVQAVSLLLNDSFVAVGTFAGYLYVWSTTGGAGTTEPVASKPIDEEGVWSICPDGNTVYLGCNRGQIYVYEFDFAMQLEQKKLIKAEGYQAVFAMQKLKGFLYATLGESIGKIDTKTGKTLKVMKDHGHYVTNLHVFDDLLWSCGQDGMVIQYGDNDKKKACFSDLNKGAVNCATVVGDFVFSGGADWKMAKAQVSTGQGFGAWREHAAPIQQIFSYGDLLATLSIDAQVRLWNKEGACQRTLEGHRKQMTCGTISEAGVLYTGADDGTVKAWQVETTVPLAPKLVYADSGKKLEALADGALPVSTPAAEGAAAPAAPEMEMVTLDLNDDPAEEGMTEEKNPLALG